MEVKNLFYFLFKFEFSVSFFSGSSFEGQWQNGRRHGLGVKQEVDGYTGVNGLADQRDDMEFDKVLHQQQNMKEHGRVDFKMVMDLKRMLMEVRYFIIQVDSISVVKRGCDVQLRLTSTLHNLTINF